MTLITLNFFYLDTDVIVDENNHGNSTSKDVDTNDEASDTLGPSFESRSITIQ